MIHYLVFRNEGLILKLCLVVEIQTIRDRTLKMFDAATKEGEFGAIASQQQLLIAFLNV